MPPSRHGAAAARTAPPWRPASAAGRWLESSFGVRAVARLDGAVGGAAVAAVGVIYKTLGPSLGYYLKRFKLKMLLLVRERLVEIVKKTRWNQS